MRLAPAMPRVDNVGENSQDDRFPRGVVDEERNKDKR